MRTNTEVLQAFVGALLVFEVASVVLSVSCTAAGSALLHDFGVHEEITDATGIAAAGSAVLAIPEVLALMVICAAVTANMRLQAPNSFQVGVAGVGVASALASLTTLSWASAREKNDAWFYLASCILGEGMILGSVGLLALMVACISVNGLGPRELLISIGVLAAIEAAVVALSAGSAFIGYEVWDAIASHTSLNLLPAPMDASIAESADGAAKWTLPLFMLAATIGLCAQAGRLPTFDSLFGAYSGRSTVMLCALLLCVVSYFFGFK